MSIKHLTSTSGKKDWLDIQVDVITSTDIVVERSGDIEVEGIIKVDTIVEKTPANGTKVEDVTCLDGKAYSLTQDPATINTELTNKKYVDDEILAISHWDRVGTDLFPTNPGDHVAGGVAVGGDFYIDSTTNASKGSIFLGPISFTDINIEADPGNDLYIKSALNQQVTFRDSSNIDQLYLTDSTSQVTVKTDLNLDYSAGDKILYTDATKDVNDVTLGTSMNLTTGTLNTIQGIRVTDSPTFVTETLSGLTASKLVETDGAKALQSVTDLSGHILGGTNITATGTDPLTLNNDNTQALNIGDSPTFVTETLSGLTASKLVETDGAKALQSVTDLSGHFTQTANQVLISGTDPLTFSTPQDIHTGASPTFDVLTVDQLALSGANEKITGSAHTIDMSAGGMIKIIPGDQAILKLSGNVTNGDSIFSLDKTADTDLLQLRFASNSVKKWYMRMTASDDDFKIYNFGLTADAMIIDSATNSVTFSDDIAVDGNILCDTINEKTGGSGVNVDSMLIKDGVLTYNSQTMTFGASSIEFDGASNCEYFFKGSDPLGNTNVYIDKDATADQGSLIFATAGTPNMALLHPTGATSELQIYDYIATATRLTIASDGKITLGSGTGINEFSLDGTLAGNSDDALPTEKAVKSYVDAQTVTNLCHAYNISSLDNVTGDGTVYTIIYPNERFDSDGDYNTGTGVYTVATTGYYSISLNLIINGINTANHTQMESKIVAGGVTYLCGFDVPQYTGIHEHHATILVSLTATQTVHSTIEIQGDSKVCDVVATSNMCIMKVS